MRIGTLLSIVLIALASAPLAAGAQEHQHAAGAELGTVEFPVSCNAEAQKGKEEEVEKYAVTPGPLLPARELLGDILLVHNSRPMHWLPTRRR